MGQPAKVRFGWGIGPFSQLFDLVMVLGHRGLRGWRLEAELGGGTVERYRYELGGDGMVREVETATQPAAAPGEAPPAAAPAVRMTGGERDDGREVKGVCGCR